MTARKVDVVGYLCTKLEDTNSTAMGTGLEAGTLRKILEDISEMYAEAIVLRKLPQVFH